MRHFLPKRSSSTAASGRPKSAPPQQPVKPASTTPSAAAAAAQPAKAEPRLRSRSARRYPFPKRQGPRPKLARKEEEGAKSRAGRTTPQEASAEPPSTSLNAGCRGRCVLCKSCCEYWVHVSCAHTNSRCDSEQNKTQTSSKREQISSSNHKGCLVPLRWPTARTNYTLGHSGRGLAGHPRSVRLGIGDSKKRLLTPVRSKAPAFQRRGPHRGDEQGRSRPALRGDDIAGKGRHRSGPSSPERLGVLQPLLPRPQEGWDSSTHSRFKTLESGPHETAVQDVNSEADPLARSLRGLVSLAGSERRILSHPDSPHHRRFLRFAFEGVAYQYTVLPFGLSLAPRTFTKCMDAALAPLRQRGIRILNYLDDWLVLAQSEEELLSHRTLLLSHLECLGLKVNLPKSMLHPSRKISFLGAIFDSTQLRAMVVPERALLIQQLAGSFRAGARFPLKRFQRMLGLMASASPVLELGLLRMRPLQRWLKPRVPPHAWRHGRLHVNVDRACVKALAPWKDLQWYKRGVPLGLVCRRKVVTTDASNRGWGALCDGSPAFGLWSKAEEGFHINCLEMLAVCHALCAFLPDLKGHHVLVRSDSMTVVSYINRQGGLSSRLLFTLVKDLLEWAQCNLASLRAVHVPGKLNQGADMLSRSNVPSGEWMLHPQTREMRWPTIGPTSSCMLFPDVFDSSNTQTSQGTTSQAPPGGPALEDSAMVPGAMSAALRSPLADPLETRPSLSGERGHLASPAQSMGLTPVVFEREPENLSEGVLNTISQARAPSTRRLYAFKWSVFSTWCSTQLLDKGRSPSTLKVYVAAIAASHAPIAGQSIGRNNLVIRFLKGSRRMNPSRPHTIPTWDLSTVLRALKSSPFEPLSDADLKTLTLKSALLLALVSVKRIGDLQALSISPSCLEFGPGDSKVILKPRHGYVPKVPSTPFRAQVVTLSALPSSEGDQELSLLCPVRALRMYVERSAPFRKSDQLFVCFGGRNKGQPVTKQRLSRWIVDAISLAYSSLGLECPVGVRAHSTRGVASSWAWSSGVSMAEICAAAGWASPSTFTRFYSLDIPALQAGILSA
ncbi:ORF V: Enzymatic polyprotein [Labeo rohita]|uniref:ribonuclease H n=1 Tax=Labeo rohita TaxID=84645 RepID=A0ABQ8LSL2_LABRO|nr:ORF V: Enzymatic polyprotein [Labeo rohita]